MRENVEYCPVPFVLKVVTIFRASVGVATALRHFKIAINLNKNFGLLIHHPSLFKLVILMNISKYEKMKNDSQ